MGEASFTAQTNCRVALGSVPPCRTLALALPTLQQQSGLDKTQCSSVTPPTVSGVRTPWNGCLGFAKHCQMPSLGHITVR